MTYEYPRAREHAKSLGIAMDESALERFDTHIADPLGLTLEQRDIVMMSHVTHVARLFDPRVYTWLARLMLAVHFLNPFNSNR